METLFLLLVDTVQSNRFSSFPLSYYSLLMSVVATMPYVELSKTTLQGWILFRAHVGHEREDFHTVRPRSGVVHL